MTPTTLIKLKSEIIAEIRNNKRLKNRLTLELDISLSTLNRQLSINSDDLTKASALKIIGEELGYSSDELLTEV